MSMVGTLPSHRLDSNLSKIKSMPLLYDILPERKKPSGEMNSNESNKETVAQNTSSSMLFSETYSKDDESVDNVSESESLALSNTAEMKGYDDGAADWENHMVLIDGSDDSEAASYEISSTHSHAELQKHKKRKSDPFKLKKVKKMLRKTFSDHDAANADKEYATDLKNPLSSNHTIAIENVLSPSYKQKADDFHKFFKNLPESERLLADYACAWMKDILVQGRLYVSQNYVCFHSNILKWQTVLIANFEDIQNITKEKTAKFIPNAIQFQIKGRDKAPTFTSFTQRDRAFQQINKLWKNFHADKPLTVQELWNEVQGNDRIGSSDEDGGKPASPVTKAPHVNKSKKRTKTKTTMAANGSCNKEDDISSNQPDSHINGDKVNGSATEQSSEGIKSSSQESLTNGCRGSLKEDNTGEDDNCPAEHCKEDLRRTYLSREYNVTASTMFQTLFADESTFMKEFLEEKGSHNVEVGDWEEGTGEYHNQKVKHLFYALALNNPLAPKLSKVDETQVFYSEKSETNRSYAVDCTARMRQGVPYADYFVTVMRYCIRKTSGDACELRVTVDIRYIKTPWGLIKTFIEKNVAGGMTDNFNLLDRKLEGFFARNLHQRRPNSLPLSKNQPSASKSQKRPNKPNSQGLSSKQNGKSSSFSSLHRKDTNNATSSDSFTAPPNRIGNQVDPPKYHYKTETKKLKLLSMFVFVVLSLLLWSHYTMYKRLDFLESLHSSVSSTRLDPSRQNPNSIYDVLDDDAVLKRLTSLEHRLEGLEVIVQEHVTLSNQRQIALQKQLNQILREIRRSAPT